MQYWNEYWRNKLDQSVIVYDVRYGKVYGGSDPSRKIKQVQKDSNGYVPGGDFTMELDVLNRSLVMWINNEKIVDAENIADFQFSPIVIFRGKHEITFEIEKFTSDLKAVTSLKLEADGESKQTIVCNGFSDNNKDVTVSSCKRRVKCNYLTTRNNGYCFLDHPKIEKNQVLQWTLRVPKFELGLIGMVIILE